MKLRTLMLAMLLAGTAAGCAHGGPAVVTDPDAPRSLPGQGPVSVRWGDPAGFSELRHSGSRWAAARGDWVRQLAEHVRESAARRLPPGERLEVEITDIERAGDFEPWRTRGDDIRILREIYPPRISLRFRRVDAGGTVVAEGERELSDAAFMMKDSIGGRSDSLRYEKRLIDDWLREEFPRQDG
jgi:hypothetical protein